MVLVEERVPKTRYATRRSCRVVPERKVKVAMVWVWMSVPS